MLDKLLFDSYPGDTNEIMFSYFVRSIEKVFKRDITDYTLAKTSKTEPFSSVFGRAE